MLRLKTHKVGSWASLEVYCPIQLFISAHTRLLTTGNRDVELTASFILSPFTGIAIHMFTPIGNLLASIKGISRLSAQHARIFKRESSAADAEGLSQ